MWEGKRALPVGAVSARSTHSSESQWTAAKGGERTFCNLISARRSQVIPPRSDRCEVQPNFGFIGVSRFIGVGPNLPVRRTAKSHPYDPVILIFSAIRSVNIQESRMPAM